MKNLPVKILSNALPPEKKADFEQVKKSQTTLITDVKFSKVYFFLILEDHLTFFYLLVCLIIMCIFEISDYFP